MKRISRIVLGCLIPFALSSCAYDSASSYNNRYSGYRPDFNADYSSRLPGSMNTNGKKIVLVDPAVHTWGAYGEDGNLIRAGIATAGGDFCPDIGKPCRTDVGTFRVSSVGGGECKSKKYPLPNGGGLMPYCMFFSNGQALHGSPDNALIEANISHGCVRMRIPDAEWLRNNFVAVGTKVVVLPY